MSQRPKTEAASLLHTLRLLGPQIFRRWSFYKGPLLRFIHISLEVMVDSEKGCSKCTKPLLPYPYRKARGRQALHWIFANFERPEDVGSNFYQETI